MFTLIFLFFIKLYDEHFGQNMCDNPYYQNMCFGNMKIPRSNMPQLSKQVTDNYIKTKRSLITKIDRENVWKITPTQLEIYLKPVINIINNSTSNNYDICSDERSMILVSYNEKTNEMYVIDGHHRYAACYLMNRDLNIILIYGIIIDILEELKSFDGVLYENQLD